ncbi:hypothetical protein NM208_g11285 [Fusarium decemcellulare]|uniref:Uncharacterized protein n=1 Tax=Fusarium decemcellulare TaxID=57161 RepID=A0ACC1RUX6_9HYPO|nr:hypothetical protein NM208_g11285 [Fusarium decemcellulare]
MEKRSVRLQPPSGHDRRRAKCQSPFLQAGAPATEKQDKRPKEMSRNLKYGVPRTPGILEDRDPEGGAWEVGEAAPHFALLGCKASRDRIRQFVPASVLLLCFHAFHADKHSTAGKPHGLTRPVAPLLPLCRAATSREAMPNTTFTTTGISKLHPSSTCLADEDAAGTSPFGAVGLDLTVATSSNLQAPRLDTDARAPDKLNRHIRSILGNPQPKSLYRVGWLSVMLVDDSVSPCRPTVDALVKVSSIFPCVLENSFLFATEKDGSMYPSMP